MTKKQSVVSSYQQAIEQVRQAVAALNAQRESVLERREKLVEKWRLNLNQPLSKAAMIGLCSRVVDANARLYLKRFHATTGPESMKIQTQANPAIRGLVLADVPLLTHEGTALLWPDGGMPCPISMQRVSAWFAENSPSFAQCYFFGDAIKAKLPQLWESVKLPHQDDGKSLQERENEVSQLQAQIDVADSDLAEIDVQLNELKVGNE